ncbi:MAG: DUF2178 domain-containing protein [Oscillospiraceae bacterium]|jgi:uncharacterized membrane protein|nr:DUF2178 domain-containing protein [Oscillospiraceae bacterium]
MKNKTKYCFFIILGVILIAGGIMAIIHESNKEFTTIFGKFGGAFIGGSIGCGIACFILKSPKYKNVDDERNVTVREKAGYIAFNITLFALIILELICIIFDFESALIFILIALSIQLISFLVALIFINGKM